MNNRERQWYEGKYEKHPATCTCVECCEKRRLSSVKEAKNRDEQAEMRSGAAERVSEIESRLRDNIGNL